MCFFNNCNRCCVNTPPTRPDRRPTATQRGQRGPQGPQGPSGFDGIAYFYNATQTTAATTAVALGTATIFPTTANWITYTSGGNTITLQPGLYKITYTATAVGTSEATNPEIEIYLNGAAYAPSLSQSQQGTTGTLANVLVLQVTATSTLQLYNPTALAYTLNNLNLTIEKINTAGTTNTTTTPVNTTTLVYY